MTDEDLIAALNALLAAQTPDARRAVIEAQAILLLTGRAEELLAQEAQRRETEEEKERLAGAAALLQACREQGVAATFQAIADQARADRLDQLAAAMTRAPQLDQLAGLLHAHPDLLTDLPQLIERLEAMAANLAAHQDFLAQVAREGLPPPAQGEEDAELQRQLEALWTRLMEIRGRADPASIEEIIGTSEKLLRLAGDRLTSESLAFIQLIRTTALLSRAERRSGQGTLDDLDAAIAACEVALAIWTSAANPKDHAAAQMARADARRMRAERRSGQGALDDLDAAIAACDAALAIWTPETNPEGHAWAQTNRATALLRRATRRSGRMALDDLEAAIASFDAALAIRTPEADPDRHALAQIEPCRVSRRLFRLSPTPPRRGSPVQGRSGPQLRRVGCCRWARGCAGC